METAILSNLPALTADVQRHAPRPRRPGRSALFERLVRLWRALTG